MSYHAPIIKILHTADSHLGYRQYQSDIRRDDFFSSFDQVVDNAIDMGVDAVVHAGDLFDSRNPSLDDLIRTIRILSKLKQNNIPFLGIVGNHESKQNTQWLDLFSGMGLVVRLGSIPFILNKKNIEVAFYGIDNLSNARFYTYDFSGFEAHSRKDPGLRLYSVLVLHQLLEPLVPGQLLSVENFLSKIPIRFDAVLLGDNHTYECIRYKDAEVLTEFETSDLWVTYSGSTERCSASEEAPRSFNIVSFYEDSVQITRRNIRTRPFLIIPMKYSEEALGSPESSKSVSDSIYETIREHADSIPDSVVFVEISGLKKTLISYTEIEEYLLKMGAVVARVSDRRDVYEKSDEPEEKSLYFRDPDDVVRENIRIMNLTQAGHIMDSIVRDSSVSKSSVDATADQKLTEFMDTLDFTKEILRPTKSLAADMMPFNQNQSCLNPSHPIDSSESDCSLTPKSILPMSSDVCSL